MSDKNIQYRQGDVFITRVEALPPGKLEPIAREDGKVILAHGEVTGHYHGISNPTVNFFTAEDGSRYMECPEAADLNHQEHSTINLPAGIYKVEQQREYSPAAIRSVAD